MVTAIGLPHSWVLRPVDQHGVQTMADVGQMTLFNEQTSMSSMARDLSRSGRRTRLVVTLEPGYRLRKLTDATLSSVYFIKKGTEDDRPRWNPKPKPSCSVTKYAFTEGAHLVDHVYKEHFGQVVWALDTALKGHATALDEFFLTVDAGLARLLQGSPALPEPTMTDENDIIPLEPTMHSLFDAHSVMFSPLGVPSWIWLSKERPPPMGAMPPPMGAMVMLEGLNPPGPFEELQRRLERYPETAPAILASSVKIVLKALGTPELQSFYKVTARSLDIQQANESKEPSSSGSKASRKPSERGSGASKKPRRGSSGGNRSSSSRPASWSLNASSSSRRLDQQLDLLASLPPSDPPGSEEGDGQQADGEQPQEPASTSTGSSSDPSGTLSNSRSGLGSSSETKDTPNTSAGSEALSKPTGGSQAVAEPAGDMEKDLTDRIFNDWWAEQVGMAGTKEERQAANLIESLADFEAEQEADSDDQMEELQMIEGPYEKVKYLLEHSRHRLPEQECKALEKAVKLVADEQHLERLLLDRFTASVWLGLPAILTMHQVEPSS